MKQKIFKTIKILGIILLAITAIFTILVVVASTITPLIEKREEDDDDVDLDIDCCSFLDDDEEI